MKNFSFCNPTKIEFGIDEQADILDRLNLINIFKLFTSDSPHSSYICEDYENIGVVCGYRE
ncbi:hypothetical protein [Campylobacter pinnipediorum]|uniref:hypothetical protein n=1 Tax=Campylobacter pinnipediorum TaxID=1965231 RepID=UPI00084D3530|nr:hypothetical protein [Campylobacter pinnipediorum]OPA75977.1 hypothetical protein BFG05_05415 [Campylobacter pinnipediorum subsp. pinnipediorum]OPA80679.1 hypothetical protein BFG05_08045 [Campylobacter pinnipediorum subsp. pinnipediorum]